MFPMAQVKILLTVLVGRKLRWGQAGKEKEPALMTSLLLCPPALVMPTTVPHTPLR